MPQVFVVKCKKGKDFERKEPKLMLIQTMITPETDCNNYSYIVSYYTGSIKGYIQTDNCM